MTIRDVAQQAGVSTATVSLALAGHPRIPEATRQRIQSVARELGYAPNASARGLVRRSPSVIGVVFVAGRGQALANPYVYEMLAGIQQTANRAGYQALLIDSQPLVAGRQTLVQLWAGKRVDALVVQYLPELEGEIQRAADQGVPLVVIGQPQTAQGVNWVDGDNRAAGAFAWQVIRQAGHQAAVFVSDATEGISYDRWLGFAEQAALDCCQPELVVQAGAVNPDLSTVPRSVVLVCANHQLALACLRSGHPLLAFDNLPFMDFLDPPLAVVHIDVYRLGERAAEVALQQLEPGGRLVQQRLALHELVARASLLPVQIEPVQEEDGRPADHFR